MGTNLFVRVRNFFKNFIGSASIDVYSPRYRIVSIEQDKAGNYEVVVQIINKLKVFSMRPEEILADDDMTDGFAPRDVRALTYLGYLDVNAPKYRILAKRLSEKDKKIMFAIKEKKSNKTIFKTSEQISNDKELIDGLPKEDIHTVGYTAASERHAVEEAEKNALLNKDLNE